MSSDMSDERKSTDKVLHTAGPFNSVIIQQLINIGHQSAYGGWL